MMEFIRVKWIVIFIVLITFFTFWFSFHFENWSTEDLEPDLDYKSEAFRGDESAELESLRQDLISKAYTTTTDVWWDTQDTGKHYQPDTTYSTDSPTSTPDWDDWWDNLNEDFTQETRTIETTSYGFDNWDFTSTMTPMPAKVKQDLSWLKQVDGSLLGKILQNSGSNSQSALKSDDFAASTTTSWDFEWTSGSTTELMRTTPSPVDVKDTTVALDTSTSELNRTKVTAIENGNIEASVAEASEHVNFMSDPSDDASSGDSVNIQTMVAGVNIPVYKTVGIQDINQQVQTGIDRTQAIRDVQSLNTYKQQQVATNNIVQQDINSDVSNQLENINSNSQNIISPQQVNSNVNSQNYDNGILAEVKTSIQSQTINESFNHDVNNFGSSETNVLEISLQETSDGVQKKYSNNGSSGQKMYSGTSGQEINNGISGQEIKSGTSEQGTNSGTSGQEMNSGISGQEIKSGTSGQGMNSGTSGQEINNGISGQGMNIVTSGQGMTSGISGQGMDSGTSGQGMTSGTSGQGMHSGTSGQGMTSGTSGQEMTSGTSGQEMNSGTSGQEMNSGTSGQEMNSGTLVLLDKK